MAVGVAYCGFRRRHNAQCRFRGRYQSETAWVDSSGGFSRYEREPGFQRLVQGTGKRSTPDVAFDGDPDTGVQVYQTPLLAGRVRGEVVGGTSLGSPAWAAIIAIADQGRNLEGKGALDGATQTLAHPFTACPRATST